MTEPRNKFFLVGVAIILAFAMHKIFVQTHNLVATSTYVDAIPVTILQKTNHPPAPAVIIAHGFSGSQQLMSPMATTLAQNGYVAVTFDFSGHGRNQRLMAGGVRDFTQSTAVLMADIEKVAALARKLPGVDGRIALAGHSMATDLVVRAARRDPGVSAVVALSYFAQEVTATEPKNLLIIDGALESQRLIDAGLRAVSLTALKDARSDVTYGDVAAGGGRRLALARGAEHIGVLYSQDAQAETVSWLNAVFGRSETGFIDRRGRWLAVLFVSLILLGWPLSGFLPVLSPTPLGAGLGWRQLAPRALAPAVLTPLLLWKAPTDFMPLLLGDYLTAHMALYGVLTAAALRIGRDIPVAFASGPVTPIILCGAAVATYYTLFLGAPLDAYVTSFAPTGLRVMLMAPTFAGCAAYFLADEWMTRGSGAARGGYAFSKVCFVASLAIAVALNPRRLFFLIIIAIVIVILLTVYGLVGHWVYARTRDPRPGALGAAFGLAWAIVVCFPIVD